MRGLVHEAAAPESSVQLNVEPASLELKENVAVVWFDRAGGAAVMLTTGGVRSIVQVNEAGLDTFPVGSVAVTEKAWLPAARPV